MENYLKEELERLDRHIESDLTFYRLALLPEKGYDGDSKDYETPEKAKKGLRKVGRKIYKEIMCNYDALTAMCNVRDAGDFVWEKVEETYYKYLDEWGASDTMSRDALSYFIDEYFEEVM